MATEHPTPTLTADEIEAMGTLVAAVIAADAHVGLGLRDVHAASLAGRIWAELAVLGYQVQPLADKINTDADPYVEAAEAEYSEQHPGTSWGDAMGIDEGPAFYDPPDDER